MINQSTATAASTGPAAATPGVHHAPLQHLAPGWYAIVMGLCGLALAWHRAPASWGAWTGSVALGVFALACIVFAILALATVVRGVKHPEAWAEDRRHPIRHTFIAALPVSMILLATVGVALFGPAHPARAVLEPLWWAGSLAQLYVTWWVLARWWRSSGPAAPGTPGAGKPGTGFTWMTATPALIIPIVGNVLVPLAGVPLGHSEWAAAQFGVGLLFWPLVVVLLIARLAMMGMWPERMLPTNFILVAPPAVVGTGLMQMGAPPLAVWAVWGMALFCLLWALAAVPRIAALPFGLPHWGMSFPLAAFAAFTLRLGALAPWAQVLGTALIAMASLVITLLAIKTLQGLARGTLLVPEVAPNPH